MIRPDDAQSERKCRFVYFFQLKQKILIIARQEKQNHRYRGGYQNIINMN